MIAGDEDVAGPIDVNGDKEEHHPEGSVWTCCGQIGDADGRLQGLHRAVDDSKNRC